MDVLTTLKQRLTNTTAPTTDEATDATDTHEDPDAEPGDTYLRIERDEYGIHVYEMRYEQRATSADGSHYYGWGKHQLQRFQTDAELEAYRDTLTTFLDAETDELCFGRSE